MQKSTVCSCLFRISIQSCLQCGAQVGELQGCKKDGCCTIHPDTPSKALSSSSDIISIMMPFQKFMSSAASKLCLNPCSCEYNQYRQSVLLSALRVGTMSLPMKMINNVTLANNIGYMKSLFIPLCIFGLVYLLQSIHSYTTVCSVFI